MKKLFLIIGIICLAAGTLSLLFAALNLFGYYSVLDGSSSLYGSLHRRAIVFAVIGIVLAAAGIACLVIRAKRY